MSTTTEPTTLTGLRQRYAEAALWRLSIGHHTAQKDRFKVLAVEVIGDRAFVKIAWTYALHGDRTLFPQTTMDRAAKNKIAHYYWLPYAVKIADIWDWECDHRSRKDATFNLTISASALAVYDAARVGGES